MNLDDGNAARLAQIEQQLAREEPRLAADLRRWRHPRGPWTARLIVAGGLVFAVVALLLVSIGWALLAALTTAFGWCLSRVDRGDPPLPPMEAGPALPRRRRG